jgi:formylglycine-generating enzyme required for sulfatase activity
MKSGFKRTCASIANSVPVEADGPKEAGLKRLRFTDRPAYPAANLTWDEAQAFCRWLTERERAAGTLQADRVYRLPQDWEWSVAVGLKESRQGTPADRSGKIADVYPWGNRWPPPKDAGNYSLSPKLNIDSFDGTAPVGSFRANMFGLFDMGGYVWDVGRGSVLVVRDEAGSAGRVFVGPRFVGSALVVP